MSCKEAYKEYVDAGNDWTSIAEELNRILDPHTSRPGYSGEPLMAGSDRFQRVAHLTEKKREARKRRQAARANLIEAKKRHRD